MEQGVGAGWKKGVFGGVSLHMIWRFFRKIYIRGPNDVFNHVRFGKFCGYLCVFKGIGGAGPIAGIRGVGGMGGRVGAISVLPPVKLYICHGFW